MNYRDPRTGVVHKKFRPPYGIPRKPVRGGRWEVRKMDPPDSAYGRLQKWDKPWAARTKGTAKWYNRRFRTQAEAIAWAQRVAYWYGQVKQSTPYAQRKRAIDELRACAAEKYPNRVNSTATALTPWGYR